MTDEQVEQQPEPECVPVQVVGRKGTSALVQTDEFKRYYVPASRVKDGQVDKADLDKSVQYGIQWEAYLEPILPEILVLWLRKRGIYTVDDLAARDRELIRIGTKLISQAVRQAAQEAAKRKPPKKR